MPKLTPEQAAILLDIINQYVPDRAFVDQLDKEALDSLREIVLEKNRKMVPAPQASPSRAAEFFEEMVQNQIKADRKALGNTF